MHGLVSAYPNVMEVLLMSKSTRKPHQPVTLPAFQREATYPPAIARLLQDLIDNRRTGITTIKLGELGHCGISQKLHALRPDGWIIESTRVPVLGTNNEVRCWVSNYSVVGCNVKFCKEVI
jgi:hypothetical protein